MRDIRQKFSVKYFLNLVLVDEEDRRYFKQQVYKVFQERYTNKYKKNLKFIFYFGKKKYLNVILLYLYKILKYTKQNLQKNFQTKTFRCLIYSAKFFKIQEITLWRKADKPVRKPLSKQVLQSSIQTTSGLDNNSTDKHKNSEVDTKLTPKSTKKNTNETLP